MKRFILYREESVTRVEIEPEYHLCVEVKGNQWEFPFFKPSLVELAKEHYKYARSGGKDFLIENEDRITTLASLELRCSSEGRMLSELNRREIQEYYLAYCRASGLLVDSCQRTIDRTLFGMKA